MENDIIDDLKRQIELARIELSVKEQLLDRWQNAEKYKNEATNKPAQTILMDTTDVIDVSSLIDEKPKRNALIEEVKQVVEKFGDQEFTVAHIDKVLKSKSGLPQDDMSNRARISTALSRLKDSGCLEMTAKGGGNVPNRYKKSMTGTSNDDL